MPSNEPVQTATPTTPAASVSTPVTPSTPISPVTPVTPGEVGTSATTSATTTQPVVTPKTSGEPASEKPKSVTPDLPGAGKGLLGDVPKTEGEQPKEGEPSKEPEKTQPAVLPQYKEFQLPDNIVNDTAKVSEFTKLLGEHELSAYTNPHQAFEELGQRMIDIHCREMSALQEKLLKDYQTQGYDHYQETRANWRKSAMEDLEFGGRKFKENLQLANGVIQRYGGNASEKTELIKALDYTGAADHPSVVKFFMRMGVALREGQPKEQPIKGPAQQKQSVASKRYGNITDIT